ncbi:MAG TPA: hypothetical protein VHI73_04475 [Solirubrobacteraceae bacterium]|jgi:hypothetical protein|nr:hypothetical protein [Solirubrobacteraceae bacterium]
MKIGSLCTDDDLLARLQAPPDLRDGVYSLAYWRQRRARLPWYRRRARREAARMAVVWERRVCGALVRQRGVSLWERLQGVGLVAAGPLRRWARRGGLALAATTVAFLATLALLALVPALLAVELLLKLL